MAVTLVLENSCGTKPLMAQRRNQTASCRVVAGMNQFMLVKGAAAVDEPGMNKVNQGVVGEPVVQNDVSVELVFREHWKPMHRLATVLVGNPQTGEEIAQEAFTRWYVHRQSVQNPGGYLRTSVVNLAKGQHRRWRVSANKAHVLQVEATQAAFSPHDEMLELLDALPHRQRAAVALRYYEGASESEIADILGCRPGTVKSLLSRALSALRITLTLADELDQESGRADA
jgi:RNA polymerase sigma factor (sigma-70 family)